MLGVIVTALIVGVVTAAIAAWLLMIGLSLAGVSVGFWPCFLIVGAIRWAADPTLVVDR